VTIKSVILNRGNCKMPESGISGHLPQTLKFGQTYISSAAGCNLIEVQVTTDQGIATFTPATVEQPTQQPSVSTAPVIPNGDNTMNAPPQTAAEDPYQDAYFKGQMVEFTHEFSDFLTSIQSIYFAGACKVLDANNLAILVISKRTTFVRQWLDKGIAANPYAYNHSANGKLVDAIDPDLDNGIAKAARDGAAQGRPDQCLYWSEHPEVIYAIRQAAYAAAIGSMH
jgi:hypothetical protein